MGANKLYGNFEGRDYYGDYTVNPVTGQVNPFMNCGDPIANTGWLDDYCGDVVFMQGCGTFDLAPLDTQRVVYAIIIGHDLERLSSVLDLRRNVSYVHNTFRSNFLQEAQAELEIKYLSTSQTEVKVLANITSDPMIHSVAADFFEYSRNFVHSLELFDDGVTDNGITGDNIFGNTWLTSANENVLYLNLKLTDTLLNAQTYEFAKYNLTLSDQISFPGLTVVDDHINNDQKINPGENVRLTFGLSNLYSFALKNVKVALQSDDPWVEIVDKVAVFDSIAVGANVAFDYDLYDESSFFSLNVAPDIPDTHTIYLNLHILDDQFHLWNKRCSLKVEPLEYSPNLIIPAHIAGRSAARFSISVIFPEELTGHNYLITVSDSINERRDKGFNLVDQTLGTTILGNHEVPLAFAYNVPITDGFKIVEAYLPEGGTNDVVYENVAGGHETGFAGVGYGAPYFGGGVFQGYARSDEMWAVELVFTNRIDSSGVVGSPGGQGCFRYQIGQTGGPTGFFPGAIEAWKVYQGQRLNLLNVCFQENPYFLPIDNVWAPDASQLGGMETLYIMKSDYDPTGQIYLGQNIDMNNVLYKVCLRLSSETAIVDASDQMAFDWEAAASSEDVFAFVPTNVNQNTPDVPGDFELFQNYPNPFNAVTTIKFSLAEATVVSLKIYNIMGQEVVELVNEQQGNGIHKIKWDGKDKTGQLIATGLYFARLQYLNKSKFIKIIFIK